MDWMTMLIVALLLKVKDFLIEQAIDDSVDSFVRDPIFYMHFFISLISSGSSYLKDQILPPSGVAAGPWPSYKYYLVAFGIYFRITACCRKLHWDGKFACGVFHLLDKHHLKSVLLHTLKKFEDEDDKFFKAQMKDMEKMIGRMSQFEQQLEKIHTAVDKQHPRFPAYLDANLQKLSNLCRVQSAQTSGTGQSHARTGQRRARTGQSRAREGI